MLVLVEHEKQKHLRGRSEKEIIDLILSGLNEGDPTVTYEIVSLEIEAIKHAISLAEEGTFIIALSDVIENAIDIVQNYLDLEIEKGESING